MPWCIKFLDCGQQAGTFHFQHLVAVLQLALNNDGVFPHLTNCLDIGGDRQSEALGNLWPDLGCITVDGLTPGEYKIIAADFFQSLQRLWYWLRRCPRRQKRGCSADKHCLLPSPDIREVRTLPVEAP